MAGPRGLRGKLLEKQCSTNRRLLRDFLNKMSHLGGQLLGDGSFFQQSFAAGNGVSQVAVIVRAAWFLLQIRAQDFIGKCVRARSTRYCTTPQLS